MNFMIAYFLAVLLAFHSATSDTSQISRDFNEISKKCDSENQLNEYKNATTLSSLNELVLQNAKMDVKIHLHRVSILLISRYTDIVYLRINTTRRISKMIYDIENLHYSIKKSLMKKNNLETLDDVLLHLVENEEVKQELEKSLNQLNTLKFILYIFQRKCTRSSHREDLSEALLKLSREDSEEVPLQMSWNKDINDEEPLLKFYVDQECDELENLRRFSLMVRDELNEMPTSNNGVSGDHKQSESNTQNSLSESTITPIWLLHEKDIEEIQLKYVMWKAMLEEVDKEPLNALNEAIKKNGLSINFFCKILAEYFNLTTKLMECASQDDAAECEKMVTDIMRQPHYKQFFEIFSTATGPYTPNQLK